MSDEMGNFRRDVNIVKKNQVGIMEMKMTVFEIKYFISWD